MYYIQHTGHEIWLILTKYCYDTQEHQCIQSTNDFSFYTNPKFPKENWWRQLLSNTSATKM